MALGKTAIPVNFGQGLDLKTDPNQLPIGRFLSLKNAVFDTIARLTKRNGFGSLPTPTGSSSYITSYGGSLTAIGNNIQGLSQGTNTWIMKDNFVPVQVSTLAMINNMYSQSGVDAAVSPNGLVCVTFSQADTPPSGTFKYAILDYATGQTVVQPTTVTSSGGAQAFNSRVYLYNNNFVIMHDATIGSNRSFLEFIRIPVTAPLTASSVTIVSSSGSFNGRGGFDAAVSSNTLFFSLNAFGNTSILSGSISSSFAQPSNIVIISSASAGYSVNMCADPSTNVVWTTVATGSAALGVFSAYVNATDTNLVNKFSTQFAIMSNGPGDNFISGLSPIANNGVMNLFVDIRGFYSYDANLPLSRVAKVSFNQSGVLTAGSTTCARSVGLASRAFMINSLTCFLGSYQAGYQNTFFLMNSSGGVISKLAYSNGGGYVNTVMPTVTTIGSTASIPYVLQTSLTSINKSFVGVSSMSGGIAVSSAYFQTGVSLANFNFSGANIQTVEAGKTLNFNGGFLGMYDGAQFVENNFFLYPDNVEVIGSGSGLLAAGTYYYQATYQWTDAQGNFYESAPSIPVGVTVGATAATIVSVPNPRITYKTVANPIRVALYRWSTGQQVYYQVFPPTVLDSSSFNLDSTPFFDQKADSQIIGNTIIYTNGGVVEDANGPNSTAMTLFDDRLWMIDAEDQNLLWYSKQVIEKTPVEMSQLFTLFIAPTVGAEGPTGVCKCIFPMDDKLIISKKGALYYINGIGPDNTGANSQYSQPILITSSIGCDNQKSFVLTPMGLMFQTVDKGIWLLGRDLSTQYIGEDVDTFSTARVLSAVNIPNTNQVRFALSTGVDLMYDYLVKQWGTFDGSPSISSTIYNRLQTKLSSGGQVTQETIGTYLDGTQAVVMQFQTGWLNFSAIETYKRIYEMYLLGNFSSPHTIGIQIAEDYDPQVIQSVAFQPTNTVGSGSSVEQWEINFKKQQCQSVQITLTETSSSTAGAGLTISGINFTVGGKQPYPKNIPPKNRIG